MTDFKRHTPSARRSKRKPPVWDRNTAETQIAAAITHLQRARDLLKLAYAPLACGKVRDALKSAEGALRNCSVRGLRVERQQTLMEAGLAPDARPQATHTQTGNVRRYLPLRETVEDGVVVRYDSQGNRREMGRVE